MLFPRTVNNPGLALAGLIIFGVDASDDILNRPTGLRHSTGGFVEAPPFLTFTLSMV
jgi:hypothetical protein